MKKLFSLLLGAMMLCPMSSFASDKTTNIMIGAVPTLARLKTTIRSEAKGAETDRFKYDKEWGITLGIERVNNGFVVLPEFRYFHGNLKTAKIMPTSTFRYSASETPTLDYNYKLKDINEFGYMQWLGYSINSRHRVQVPLMMGIGLDWMQGAPMKNLFLVYGVKARIKIYFSQKVGMYFGGAYEAGYSTSERGTVEDKKDKANEFKLHKRNLLTEAGLTFTL